MPMERIVVVGNGIAGLTAADSLRAAGFDGELTIVGDEHHTPYSRPALSKAALLDTEDMTSHELPAASHEAQEILGVSAAGLDAGRKLVLLEDGTGLPYDGVVLATGSRARRLGTGGTAHRNELTLRTLEDALALRRRLAGRPSVVVVGGGALGMEIASGCLSAGCEVTLVSRDRPLTSQLGPYLSEVFLTAALRAGLKLAPSQALGLHEDGGRPRVSLADGSALEPDLVVSAVGDAPNTEWLATSGLLANGRLEVDTRGRVRPDIVAAGDVAAFPTARGIGRIPLWTSAIEQSKVAALALLKGDETPELDFQPYFWTEQFGLNLKASGFLPLTGRPELLEGDPHAGSALMRWPHADGTGTAVGLNYRIPIPKLRRLAHAPAAAPSAA
ncbi:NAD(P)/FAD-dependent oxidoreductase [Arthrobacter mangrovi]|uniref:Pyridine nucleotide-disulfide oxidoreductase n=1 Tax=Arthrobacter mangrovi TaxID=2966350 RepID=A0ABQ5MVF5_9MICC|nr:FAD-dependent oxidoreductase [Arthrobacter mangrovi]GLB67961.1 pyridine nucleotide-disulfide oxidoreductase [Arthrobacter mangrovi]